MYRRWRQQIKRTAAWTAAFMFAVSSVSYGAPAAQGGESGWYGPKEHAGIDFSQMQYERYDLSDMDQAVALLEEATAAKGQEQQVRERCAGILDEVDRMYTLTSLADIAYSRNMDDEAAAAEMEWMQKLYPDVIDRAASGLQNALDTDYRRVLEEEMGKNNARSLRYYEKMDPDMQKLEEQEQDLVLAYDKASAEDYQVQVDGETWTYGRLEDEVELYSDEYYEIKPALDRQRNRKVGEIYRQLAQVRHEIAREYGYDNYSDYAYAAIYGRDFTPEDAAQLRKDIKEIIVPLSEACWYVDVDFDAMYDLEPQSADEILDTMEPYVRRISGELGEAFDYMRLHGLYDIELPMEGENRSGGYTTSLPYYGDGFIFLTRYGDYWDYLSLFHEFGHYAAAHYDSTPSLFQNAYVDVSEVQSQGLQMLLVQYADEMFGDAGPAMEAQAVSDLLDSIISGAMMDEFETAVYADPDMSLDDMNALFGRIVEEYGGWYFDYDGDNCYGWDTIPHIYHSPLYYISYGTSAFPALRLWLDSGEDWEQAVDRYMTLSAQGSQLPYRKSMRQCGLEDIFQEGALTELADQVGGRLGLDGYGQGLAEKGDEQANTPQTAGDISALRPVVMVLLAAVGAVAVLQLMVLCTGFAILWVLVKDRDRRK